MYTHSHSVVAQDMGFLTTTDAVSYDVSYDVAHLEKMMARGLKYLNIACNQMQEVEASVEQFLSEYYGQVGSYFEQLEALRHEIQHYDRQITQSSRKRAKLLHSDTTQMNAVMADLQENMPEVPLDMRKDDIELEIKEIYRKLVKIYHPDVAVANGYSHQILQLINQAYGKKNLWAMREMEHSLLEHAYATEDDAEKKFLRLRERFDAIAGSITRVVERKRRLERSAAFKLKQRIAQERYLVEVIIHRAKQQIEEAKQLLFKKRIEYKALAFV